MLHVVKIHLVVVNLRGVERQHAGSQMDRVSIDVQSVQHVLNQTEMQHFQVVLDSPCTQVSFLD